MRCLLLSGGGGTRLWPLSRWDRPKQYLPLPEGGSFFGEALKRNAPIAESFMVVTNERFENLTVAELQTMSVQVPTQVVLEPLPRNTAPAVAVAALLAPSDEIILMAPTDHHVQDQALYVEAIRQAERLAQEGNLVVFGIQPTSPHTGYGYIHHQGSKVFAFKEKPDRVTAERYLQEGGYLWNSGMLAFRADVMLEELEAYCPDILEACQRVVKTAQKDGDLWRLDEELFAQVRAQSLDYAVIEQSQRIRVVPALFSWSDMGSFKAFGTLVEADELGNHISGDRVILHNAKRTCVFHAGGEQTVVINGLGDIIVAITDEAIYVTRADCADEISGLQNW